MVTHGFLRFYLDAARMGRRRFSAIPSGARERYRRVTAHECREM
jgi:hypothetical protein